MKKHSKSSQRSEPTLKRRKARGPVQRDAKEVLAEVLGKLTGKLDAPAVSTSAKENRRGNTVGPNRDRLTVGAKQKHGFLKKKFPVTQKAAWETVWIPQPALLGDEEDMHEIAAGLAKIQKNAKELV